MVHFIFRKVLLRKECVWMNAVLFTPPNFIFVTCWIPFVICLFSVIKIVLCLFTCYSGWCIPCVLYTYYIQQGRIQEFVQGGGFFFSRGAQHQLPFGLKKPWNIRNHWSRVRGLSSYRPPLNVPQIYRVSKKRDLPFISQN